MDRNEVERHIDAEVDGLGFELVALEWAGSRNRPILRLRVDRPESEPGVGITVDDCARVSRALEDWLESRGDVPERYVLEVSSPGVDRPLVRPRDWVRFAGNRVAVTGRGPLVEGASRLEGELLGVDETGERARLRTDEDEILVPLTQVKRAHIVYDWEASKRGGD